MSGNAAIFGFREITSDTTMVINLGLDSTPEVSLGMPLLMAD